MALSTAANDVVMTSPPISDDYLSETRPAMAWNASLYKFVWGPVVSLNYTLGPMTLVAVVLFVVIVATAFGNFLVGLSLFKYRYLRTISNYLIGNLALSDFLLATTVLPVSIFNECLGHWIFGEVACNAWLTMDVLYCTASLWNLCVIGFDRFTATLYPMWYRNNLSARQAGKYVAFVWAIAAIICIPPVLGWNSAVSNYVFDNETNVYKCNLFEIPSYVLYSACGSFYIPLLITSFFYVRIFIALRQRMMKNRKKAANGVAAGNSKSSQGSGKAAKLQEMEMTRVKEGDLSKRRLFSSDSDLNEDDPSEMSTAVTKVTASCVEVTRGSVCTPHRLLDGTTLECARNHDLLNCDTSSLTTDPLLGVSAAACSDRECNAVRESAEEGTSQNPNIRRVFDNVDQINDESDFHQIRVDTSCISDEKLGSKSGHDTGTASQAKNVSSETQTAKSIIHRKMTAVAKSLNPFSTTTSLNKSGVAQTAMASPTNQKAASSANQRRYEQRELRATMRMGIIIAFFCGMWIGFFTVYVLKSWCPDSCPVPRELDAFFFWLGYSNSSVNPILYTIFNEEFRRAFMKILGCYKKPATGCGREGMRLMR